MPTPARPLADLDAVPPALHASLFDRAVLLGRTAAEIEQAEQAEQVRRQPTVAALHPDSFTSANLAEHLIAAGRVLASGHHLTALFDHFAALPDDGLTALLREVWTAAIGLNRGRINTVLERARAVDALDGLYKRIQDTGWAVLEAWRLRNPPTNAVTLAAERLGIPAAEVERIRTDAVYRKAMNAARGKFRPHIPEPPTAEPVPATITRAARVLEATPQEKLREYLLPLFRPGVGGRMVAEMVKADRKFLALAQAAGYKPRKPNGEPNTEQIRTACETAAKFVREQRRAAAGAPR